VRYELNFYILFKRNSVFKGLNKANIDQNFTVCTAITFPFIIDITDIRILESTEAEWPLAVGLLYSFEVSRRLI
jgi:hypothetical protein